MKKILVIAPHPDDEVLGCGGTMLQHIKAGNEVFVCIITRGFPPMFSDDDTFRNQSDARSCHKFMGVKETIFLDFPTTKLESIDRSELNGAILNVVRSILPDEVYIPHYGDMQRDHFVVAESCMVAVRPKYFPRTPRVYGYETMSETAWNIPVAHNEFIPNVYVDITDSIEDKKKALSYYSLQVSDFPDARSIESIEALAKYRGAQMHMRAAEAFMLLRELRTIK